MKPRLEEIRERISTFQLSHLYYHQHIDSYDNTVTDMTDLLAHIDALEADKDKLSTQLVNREARLNLVLEERDYLKAELDDVRETRLAIKLVRVEQERDELKAENIELKRLTQSVESDSGFVLIKRKDSSSAAEELLLDYERLKQRVEKLRESLESQHDHPDEFVYKCPICNTLYADDPEGK